MSSPMTARLMLPRRRRLKTTIGRLVVLAQGNGRGVHHAQPALEDVDVADAREPLRLRVLHGIGGVDAVDLGRLEDDLGLDLEGPERRRGVGREVRAAEAGAEDDDPALLQVPDDPAADERLGHGLDLDGRDVPGDDALLLQGVLEGDPVHDRGQEAHLVGRNPVEAGGRAAHSAEDVPPADHDRDLDAEVVDLLDLLGDGGGRGEVDPVGLLAQERFARQLQQDPLCRPAWARAWPAHLLRSGSGRTGRPWCSP